MGVGSTSDHSNYVYTPLTRLTAQDALMMIVTEYLVSRQRESTSSVNRRCRREDESLHPHFEVTGPAEGRTTACRRFTDGPLLKLQHGSAREAFEETTR